MIQQRARVVAVRARNAVVETASAEHCEACAAGRGCGAGLFARLLTRRVARLAVPNDLNVVPGQQVTVGVDERALVRASVRLYGTILMALVVGAGAGHALGMARGWPADATALAGAVVLVAVGVVFLRRRPAQLQVRLVRLPNH